MTSTIIYSHTPYTYLIGWSSINKFYYGVRYAGGCHPSELWIKYFTSSKVVKEYRKEYGEPDVIEIRKEFVSVDKARLWENSVLKKMGAKDDVRFLNQTDNMSIKLTKEHYATMFTEKARHKMSESAKKRGYDKDQLAKARENITYTEERNKKISNAHKGRDITWGDKISASHMHRIKTCEHCDKTIKEITYHRWHGDNCKLFNAKLDLSH